jgi:hypothetical protein
VARLPEKQIQQNLESIKRSRKEASSAKASAVRFSKTAENISSKLTSLFNTAKVDTNAAKNETEQIKKDARKEYNSFKATFRAATNKRDGVEVRYKKVVDLHRSAQALESEISKNATTSKNATAATKDLKETARKNEKEIAEVYQRANVVKQEIEDT